MHRPPPARRPADPVRWLWLALLVAPPLAAQAEASRSGANAAALARQGLEAGPADGDAQADRRVRRRLLHARAGGVLRAESRCVDGQWQYRREGDRAWTELPAGLVDRARLESEALDELRTRRAALGRAAPAERVDLAGWALGEGLHDEALELLDDVLLEDPDQPQALALLARDDLPFGLPGHADGRPDELLQFASLAPPALRELAIARLARQPERETLREELAARLVAPRPGERAAAALALRRLAEGRFLEAELQELLRRAVRDASPEVRDAAARALRDARQPGLAVPLVAALGSEARVVRVHAAQALGTLGQPAAVPALISRLETLPRGGGGWVPPRSHLFIGTQTAFVQGFDVDIAQNAAAGDPQIGVLSSGASLDVAVLGASGGPGAAAESDALRGALERLTGARPGHAVSDWTAWWQVHRAEYEPAVPVTGG